MGRARSGRSDLPWAIIDTSAYVDAWEGKVGISLLEQAVQGLVVRQAAVVLSELRRGARTPAAMQLVRSLRATAKVIWAPAADDWWEAGRLVLELGDAQGWEVQKRREFQNDALIALTARRHGAAVVTSNGADFRLLARAVRYRLIAL
ncbi:MAG: PIN domain-containing protein [Myxococcales bacterium]|nr:PIN domain-containing protein [Myxococcales bacterium]